jgi:OmpA-OmpF porin, OOP family
MVREAGNQVAKQDKEVAMRKLVIGLALASTAMAAPALARDNSGYVGVSGGVMGVEDQDLDLRVGTRTTLNGVTVEYKKGYDFDGVAGYDFGMIRGELEIGYKRATVDSMRFTQPVLVTGPTTAYGGRGEVLSGMGNLLLDFGNSGLSGFAGGGVGVARTKSRGDVAGPNIPAGSGFSGSDNHFAYQALAGVRVAVGPNVDLGLKYRFFNTKFRYADAAAPLGGQEIKGRWRSHSLLLTLAFNLAAGVAVLAPAPPPPPAAPPPPPATQICPNGSVILATDVCPAPPPPPPPAAAAPERG